MASGKLTSFSIRDFKSVGRSLGYLTIDILGSLVRSVGVIYVFCKVEPSKASNVSILTIFPAHTLVTHQQ